MGDAGSGALRIQVSRAGRLAVQAWGDVGMEDLVVEVQLSKAEGLGVQGAGMGEHRPHGTSGETPCSLPSGILRLAGLSGWRGDWGVRVQCPGAVWLQM